jgi:hypothetical protein
MSQESTFSEQNSDFNFPHHVVPSSSTSPSHTHSLPLPIGVTSYHTPLPSLQMINNGFELPCDYLLETWWPSLPASPSPLPSGAFLYSQNTLDYQNLLELMKTTQRNIHERYLSIAYQTIGRLIYLLEQTGLPSLSLPHVSDYSPLPPYPGTIATATATPAHPSLSLTSSAVVGVGSGGFGTTNLPQTGSGLLTWGGLGPSGGLNLQYLLTQQKISLQFGVNFISIIHSKPSRIIQIKHWKFWLKKYWQPSRLSDELENEIKSLENDIQEIGKNLKETQKMVKWYENEVKMFGGYLNSSRETMIAIGMKTKQYADETYHTKQAKVRERVA